MSGTRVPAATLGLLLALAIIAARQACAVELENWRLPFYEAAVDLDTMRTSPSGMFWDDLSGAATFGPGLWPDTAVYRANHWTLEPVLSAGLDGDTGIDGKRRHWNGGALNDIRLWNLTARQVLTVDSRFKGDPAFVWKKDRAAAGRIEEAYLQVDWKHGMLRLGRLHRTWGPFADRSLILSSNPFAYDALEWQVFTRLFEFRQLFAAFVYPSGGDYGLDVDGGAKVNRFLAAHSLNVMLGSWATLGVTETMLFTRTTEFPDLQFVNPFSIYTVTNTNGEGRGNLMVGFGGVVHPFVKDVTLKGQLVIDDIQVDNKGPGDQEPNHWGGDFGAYWRNPLPVGLRHVVKIEYRYLSRWLYTVNDNDAAVGERYSYLGKSLGSPTSDGDQVDGGITLAGVDHWLASAGCRYVRQGANTVQSRWSDLPTVTASGSLGYREETPLSKRAIDKRFELYVEGRAYFRDFADVAVSLTNRWTSDLARPAFTYDPVAAATFSVHYPDFWVRLPH